MEKEATMLLYNEAKLIISHDSGLNQAIPKQDLIHDGRTWLSWTCDHINDHINEHFCTPSHSHIKGNFVLKACRSTSLIYAGRTLPEQIIVHSLRS